MTLHSKIFQKILILSVVFCSPLYAQIIKYDYSLEAVYKKDGVYTFPADFNNDGIDELVVFDAGGYQGDIDIIDQNGGYISQYRYGKDILFSPYPMEVRNPNGVKGIVITYRKDDSIFASILKGPGGWKRNIFLQKRPLIEGHSHPEWSGEFLPCFYYDINRDGSEDIIGIWCSGVANYPRGFAAYDVKNGRELWYYKTGAQLFPWLSIFEDIDNDKLPEIIFGTSASNNGAVFNGNSDDSSYVFVIDLTGKLKWKHAYGGIFNTIKVIAKQLQNGKEILICQETTCNTDRNKCDRIMLIDANNGKIIKAVNYGQKGRQSVVADIMNTGTPQIITGNTDGKIRVYTTDIELMGEYLYKSDNFIDVVAVDDYENDGYKEIIALTQDGYVVVLNHKLQAKIIEKRDFTCGLNNRINSVKNRKELYYLSCTVISPRKCMWELWKIKAKVAIVQNDNKYAVVLIIGILFITALILPSLLFKQRNKFRFILDKLDDCGIIITNSNGKIIYANKWIRNIFLFTGKDIDKSNITDFISGDIKKGTGLKLQLANKATKVIKIKWEQIDNGFLIVLTDEEESAQCKRITAWAPVAQEMAHGIKTPLTTVLLAAQKISAICAEYNDKNKILDYSYSIEEEVTRLQKVTDGFMRFIQREEINRRSINAAAFLHNIIETKRALLNNKVALSIKTDDVLPNLLIDAKQMETAVGNILDNAIEAVLQGGRIEVIAKKTEKMLDGKIKEFVKIGIIDNGPGIKSTYQSQLFKPFASFRPGGTGLGLLLAKKIIEDHDGIIRLDSKEGHGTTVTIILPVEK